jgi:dienelactone hydrolase
MTMDGTDGSRLPASVNRYSATAYLQSRIASSCAGLPRSFASLEEWLSFRVSLVSRLRALLPVWEVGDPGPDRVTAELDLGGALVLEAVDVALEGGFCAPVHVYRKRGARAASPAVIVCPGYAQPKNEAELASFCMGLAEKGFVAVAVEYDGTGERADRPDPATDIDNVSALAALVGITNVGLRVMTNLAVLRHLEGRSDVDGTRVGITGLCQGAIVTWYTAAVCDRLAAVAPLCGATTYEAIALEYANRQGGWSGISPYVFGLLGTADVQHVLACVAPRPLFVQNNIVDRHWPFSGFETVKRLVGHVYDLHDAGPKAVFRVEHGPHAFAEPFRSALTDWFARVLAPW